MYNKPITLPSKQSQRIPKTPDAAKGIPNHLANHLGSGLIFHMHFVHQIKLPKQESINKL
jgi:hypothetical protein